MQLITLSPYALQFLQSS